MTSSLSFQPLVPGHVGKYPSCTPNGKTTGMETNNTHQVFEKELSGEKQLSLNQKLLNCMRAFLYCIVGSASYRRRRQQMAQFHGRNRNSVSLVDKIARTLFPVAFLLFNVFYWVIYCSTALSWSENEDAVHDVQNQR